MCLQWLESPPQAVFGTSDNPVAAFSASIPGIKSAKMVNPKGWKDAVQRARYDELCNTFPSMMAIPQNIAPNGKSYFEGHLTTQVSPVEQRFGHCAETCPLIILR